MATSTWTVAEAKAHFSEVIDMARQEGPQTITRHGKDAVVVVDAGEWERRQPKREGDLASFLTQSPLSGSGLEVARLKDVPRETDL